MKIKLAGGLRRSQLALANDSSLSINLRQLLEITSKILLPRCHYEPDVLLDVP